MQPGTAIGDDKPAITAYQSPVIQIVQKPFPLTFAFTGGLSKIYYFSPAITGNPFFCTLTVPFTFNTMPSKNR